MNRTYFLKLCEELFFVVYIFVLSHIPKQVYNNLNGEG